MKQARRTDKTGLNEIGQALIGLAVGVGLALIGFLALIQEWFSDLRYRAVMVLLVFLGILIIGSVTGLITGAFRERHA